MPVEEPAPELIALADRGRTGVVLEEAEDDDDVPVTVDEADDDVEVDDLA